MARGCLKVKLHFKRIKTFGLFVFFRWDLLFLFLIAQSGCDGELLPVSAL